MGRSMKLVLLARVPPVSTRYNSASKRGGTGLPCVLPTYPDHYLTACSHAMPGVCVRSLGQTHCFTPLCSLGGMECTAVGSRGKSLLSVP